jgi:6-pyruvoyltetrahydropterin/6-carboxytetrahydropterin synthase
MICLTRRYRFSASHRLHTPLLSEADNRELYGKCNNPFGHGHDYTLEVSVRGPVDEATGRVVHIDALDRLVRSQVLEPFDHRDLNAEAPVFTQLVPTTENLAIEIRSRLEAGWASAIPGPRPSLASVRLSETRRNFFEVRGNHEESQ